MNEDRSTEQFIVLLTSNEVRLRAYALSLIPNWADADEVLQQANIVLWQKFGEFEPGTNFLAWSRRVVNLTARDFRKRQRRERVRFSDAFFEAVAEETDRLADLMAERERALEACLAKLKPEQREMMRLRYEEGGSVETVAAALDRTVQAVYQALSRVRKALFDCVNRALRAEGTS